MDNESKFGTHTVEFIFDTTDLPHDAAETVKFTMHNFDPTFKSIGLRDYCASYGLDSVASLCDTILFDGQPVDYV